MTGGGAFIKHIANAAKPVDVRMIESPGGNRIPDIFKISKAYGTTAEITPPYRPEAQPAELPRAGLKVGYAQRYDAAGVRGYIERFSPILGSRDSRASYRISTRFLRV